MSKKPDIEYEAPTVEYETPRRESNTKGQKGVKAFLKELGSCVCGRPDADASKVRVTNLWGNFYNFTCPHGFANTTVKPAVRQAAVSAGLIKEESNG